MTTVRNVAGRALDVAGRVFPAGAVVEVGEDEAGWLASNPNFEQVTAEAAPAVDAPAGGSAAPGEDAPADPPAESATRPRAGKKAKE